MIAVIFMVILLELYLFFSQKILSKAFQPIKKDPLPKTLVKVSLSKKFDWTTGFLIVMTTVHTLYPSGTEKLLPNTRLFYFNFLVKTSIDRKLSMPVF